MKKTKNSLWIILFSMIILFHSIPVQASYRVQSTDDKVVVVIDPGHGGENLGTIENGFEEKAMTLITAKAMYDELCLYDNIEVYMTRTEDIDLTLKARAEYAAAVDADFLFSIHYNASVKHDLFGSEIWISATSPYNAYGYQFGYRFLSEMKDMGLYLRGIKTKLNDKGTDYYGVIREATALSVPAAIIEHCHVDEERDYPFCDTEEELIAFGKADATAVAKYFGLKSSKLGVDYSREEWFPEAQEGKTVQATLQDDTPPDVCLIEVIDTDVNTGNITLEVIAADYDSPLLYYDYSYDGGITYSPLQMWPESDTLEGTYQDTFSFTLQVPSETKPNIILRAYNMFDRFTESNKITMLQTFLYGEDVPPGEESEDLADNNAAENQEKNEGKKLPGTQTFMPAVKMEIEEEEVSFLTFLQICLGLVLLLFVILLITRCITYYKRMKRRRQRRKEAGNSRNHKR